MHWYERSCVGLLAHAARHRVTSGLCSNSFEEHHRRYPVGVLPSRRRPPANHADPPPDSRTSFTRATSEYFGRPPRHRLARVQKLKPREARQRSYGPGHDGIADPQRVHGRTRVERQRPSSPQQYLRRDTSLRSRDTERPRLSHQLFQAFRKCRPRNAHQHTRPKFSSYTPQLSAVRVHTCSVV